MPGPVVLGMSMKKLEPLGAFTIFLMLAVIIASLDPVNAILYMPFVVVALIALSR